MSAKSPFLEFEIRPSGKVKNGGAESVPNPFGSLSLFWESFISSLPNFFFAQPKLQTKENQSEIKFVMRARRNYTV